MASKKKCARNRRTGAAIVGTLEKLEGCAHTEADQWRRDRGGEVTYEHGGYTEVYWNAQKTATDECGRTVFVDENGECVDAADVQLHERGEPFTPPHDGNGADGGGKPGADTRAPA